MYTPSNSSRTRSGELRDGSVNVLRYQPIPPLRNPLSFRPGERGSEVTFDQVLLVEKDAGDILAGAPFVANARVVGVVDGEARGPKLRVFKKKRRKGFRKTRGHRSIFTRVRITDIQV